jgi:cardiolipin synthase C
MAGEMSVQMNVMDMVMRSSHDVFISSPYFIPGPKGVAAFTELQKHDVKVTILTNSLASNDEPVVHTGYSRYRAELLRAGVDLYELSPSGIPKNKRLGFPGMSLTDRQAIEWLTMDDEGERVLTEEPDSTLLLRLQNTLLAPLVPEQQL